MTTHDRIRAIEKLLRDNHICANVYSELSDMICVEIENGDWKHDHLRAQYLINERFNPVIHSSECTEIDGSDCYSAIHRFLF